MLLAEPRIWASGGPCTFFVKEYPLRSLPMNSSFFISLRSSFIPFKSLLLYSDDLSIGLAASGLLHNRLSAQFHFSDAISSLTSTIFVCCRIRWFVNLSFLTYFPALLATLNLYAGHFLCALKIRQYPIKLQSIHFRTWYAYSSSCPLFLCTKNITWCLTWTLLNWFIVV